MARAIQQFCAVAAFGISVAGAPALAQEPTGATPFADIGITHAKTTLWSQSEAPGLQFGLGGQTSPQVSWRFEVNTSQHDFHYAGGSFSLGSGSVLFGYHPPSLGRLHVGLLAGGGMDVLTTHRSSAATGVPFTESSLFPALIFGADATVRVTRYVSMVPTFRVHQILDGHTTVISGLGVRFGQTAAEPPRRQTPSADVPGTEKLAAAELEGSVGGMKYGQQFPTYLIAQGSLNANKLWSFEGGLEKATDSSFYSLFYVQARRLVSTPTERTRIYATFGAGWDYYTVQYTRDHYTYLQSGRGGVAVEQDLATHLALRVDLQGLFFGIGDGGAAIGLRPTVGIVVPIGHRGK